MKDGQVLPQERGADLKKSQEGGSKRRYFNRGTTALIISLSSLALTGVSMFHCSSVNKEKNTMDTYFKEAVKDINMDASRAIYASLIFKAIETQGEASLVAAVENGILQARKKDIPLYQRHVIETELKKMADGVEGMTVGAVKQGLASVSETLGFSAAPLQKDIKASNKEIFKVVLMGYAVPSQDSKLAHLTKKSSAHEVMASLFRYASKRGQQPIMQKRYPVINNAELVR